MKEAEKRMINNQDFVNIFNSLKQKETVVVDNFLQEKDALFLRDRMIKQKVFDDYYRDYQATNYLITDEFTKKLAEEIVRKIKYLSDFKRAWSFVYNNKGEGVGWHADPSNINLNIWVSKNDSINDFNKNGLKICKIKPPSFWTRKEWNSNKNNCVNDLIEKNKTTIQNIKYKFNRAIFFDGAYFHKTDDVDMKEGFKNKRVSYTMLFGINDLKEN
jgi:hypothetical protein|tara:strand:- start:2824 stop:3471 length:648 start_codon:yes stop_codon:yes gene_type:complete